MPRVSLPCGIFSLQKWGSGFFFLRDIQLGTATWIAESDETVRKKGEKKEGRRWQDLPATEKRGNGNEG